MYASQVRTCARAVSRFLAVFDVAVGRVQMKLLPVLPRGVDLARETLRATCQRVHPRPLPSPRPAAHPICSPPTPLKAPRRDRVNGIAIGALSNSVMEIMNY